MIKEIKILLEQIMSISWKIYSLYRRRTSFRIVYATWRYFI